PRERSPPDRLIAGGLGEQRDPPDQEAKGAAFSGRALHPDLSALQLDQPLRERQAEANPFVAARRRAIDLTELLEEARLVLALDTDAGVAHLYHRSGIGLRCADDHAAVVRRELDRVVDQVVDDVPEAARIEDDLRGAVNLRCHGQLFL